MEIDYSSKVSREHIKKQCQAASECRRNIVSPDNHTNLVLRLTDNFAVKYGPGVTLAEAYALKYAAEHLDHEIVRVPSFVQFFTSGSEPWPIGYLVMTFVEGTTIDRSNEEDASVALKILRAVAHLHSFTHTVPGPLDGSPARGLLWSEYGAGQSFGSIGMLQDYIDIRLSQSRSLVDITNSTLHLCHMDLAPRNIIVDDRGVICLLDWGCAGFYPSSFETWAIALEAHLRPHPVTTYLASLSLNAATPVQRREISALNKVFSANQRFALYVLWLSSRR